MPASEQRRGTKSRRITRACDYCHRRSIRCLSSGTSARCQSCIQFDQSCTYNRELKRRGVKPKTNTPSQTLAPTRVHDVESTEGSERPQRLPWKAHVVASQAVVMSLVEVYFEIVYPIFPLFHRPTYIRKISRGEYATDKSLFATTMAVCALVSARVRDQALYNPSWDIQELLETQSETFYDAAVHVCTGMDLKGTQSLNSLRACALLALAALQYGRIREMQAYLGKYHVLVALDGLHDEVNWPQGIGIVETEERRRLFWSMYTLEVYASIIWSGVTRVREQQVNVAYTTELDDELFSDLGYNLHARSSVDQGPSPGSTLGEVRSSSWLCGWNFTTDLYRVLEHVIANFRDRKRRKRTFLDDIFGDRTTTSASSVRDSIMRLYSNLPRCFKEFPQVVCDPASDRFGFQAANITATVQLLRMMLFASGGGSIEERCKIASEVVDAFTRVPVAYLRAISSPLLHHLAGIGAILGSVFEEPISDIAYQQVRVVLLALAQLLENLEHGIHSTQSAQRLRNLVALIDDYMKSQQNQLHFSPPSDMHSQSTPSHPSPVYARQTEANAPRTIPPQLTTDFFDEWPWNLDFMQLTGNNWSSANLNLDM